MLIDFLYIIGTLAFFGAMGAYVLGCRRLGGQTDREPS